ncbi:MAG: PfkB family carbohydrate kinase, partial [Planctomycetota bacterium]|nr:PfkB family carbohydrate kinase [Planctomycetota bacterium]
GEHGAIVISQYGIYLLPAFPTEKVVDPTGAGDSFAGGIMGYLASVGEASYDHFRKAIRYGTVAASFNVEDYGVDRMRTLTRNEIEARHVIFLQHLGQ